ncbi:MAG: carbohydrate kinase family protein [Lachnospiraceae bacterium]|nr:carbohydrate kinase family protein [Lachnospiraceae bacterium]
MKKKAVVAGHICIDITPVFTDQTVKAEELGDILKPGKLIQMSAPDVHTGGAVANTGLGMKKLGADVRLIGKVGNDAFGGMIRDILSRHDACGDLIVEDGAITSYSVVIAAPGIDRVFLHCPGANDTFDGAQIPESALNDVALFHFGYPTLMKKMYEENGRNLVDMLRRMKEKGIATSLDMAAVDAASDAGMTDWTEILKRVLPFVDFFVPSFEELCFMLDRPLYDGLLERAGNGDITGLLKEDEDIRPLAQKCLDLGAKSVLIKCGAPGLFFMTSEKMDEVGSRLELKAEEWNGFCKFEKSYKIDKVVSATGAGDTCIAAFLTSILEGSGPETAIENAAGAGALCCMSYDAVSGLQELSEIRKKIDAGWEKAW